MKGHCPAPTINHVNDPCWSSSFLSPFNTKNVNTRKNHIGNIDLRKIKYIKHYIDVYIKNLMRTIVFCLKIWKKKKNQHKVQYKIIYCNLLMEWMNYRGKVSLPHAINRIYHRQLFQHTSFSSSNIEDHKIPNGFWAQSSVPSVSSCPVHVFARSKSRASWVP